MLMNCFVGASSSISLFRVSQPKILKVCCLDGTGEQSTASLSFALMTVPTPAYASTFLPKTSCAKSMWFCTKASANRATNPKFSFSSLFFFLLSVGNIHNFDMTWHSCSFGGCSKHVARSQEFYFF